MREAILNANNNILNVTAESIRPMMLKDLLHSMDNVKPSVNRNTLEKYLNWNVDYGSYQVKPQDLNS